MNVMQEIKWIWENENPKPDEYAEFVKEFEYSGGKAVLNISADSDFVCYVNGKLVGNGQYPDYPWEKAYNSYDITEYCVEGKNRLAVLVWYYGIEGTVIYYPDKAGLWFNISVDGTVLTVSDEQTLSRLSSVYENHREKKITGQVGLSFCYDAKKEDKWTIENADGFHNSVLSDKTSLPSERPLKYPVLEDMVEARLVKTRKNSVIFDLGAEQAGFITFKINSPKEQKLVISYGEHLADGKVRRIIDSRDFSVEYIAKKGDNEYTNYLRRIGCRYIEIESEVPVTVDMLGIIPRHYPVTVKEFSVDNGLRRRIYNTSVRTLILCMNDHYEDCPWREQGMYVMDSRNQMLCGYYAFGEYEFAKNNLILMANDKRDDGIFNMTFPARYGLTIPSFSLHYFTAVLEYLNHSGDKKTIEAIYPRMTSLLKAFIDLIEPNGLIPDLKGNYWNFYEWSKDLTGIYKSKNGRSYLHFNCLLSIALNSMQQISDMLGKETEYGKLVDELNQNINKAFFDNKKKLYCNSTAKFKRYSELGQALAVLCGAAKDMDGATETIMRKLKQRYNGLTKVTLSMAAFKYDALLYENKDNIYWVLREIDEKYGYMLNKGATSFWETIKGQKDFDKAGSLCHGWSAIPVYYYHLAKEQGIEL